MRKFALIALLGALTLSGCTATPNSASSPTTPNTETSTPDDSSEAALEEPEFGPENPANNLSEDDLSFIISACTAYYPNFAEEGLFSKLFELQQGDAEYFVETFEFQKENGLESDRDCQSLIEILQSF